jgi:hypothetical protein
VAILSQVTLFLTDLGNGGGRHMGISVDEIANAAIDQIGSHSASSIVALIGVTVVGCWLVAEVFRACFTLP